MSLSINLWSQYWRSPRPTWYEPEQEVARYENIRIRGCECCISGQSGLQVEDLCLVEVAVEEREVVVPRERDVDHHLALPPGLTLLGGLEIQRSHHTSQEDCNYCYSSYLLPSKL